MIEVAAVDAVALLDVMIVAATIAVTIGEVVTIEGVVVIVTEIDEAVIEAPGSNRIATIAVVAIPFVSGSQHVHYL